MMVQRRAVVGACLAVAIMAVSGGASSALAQRRYTPADLRSGKVTFQQFSNQRAYRSMQHARDYARDVQRYAPVVTHAEPTIIRNEAEQLGHNIQAAQQQVVTARKQAADNKEVQASFDSVEKHLATAAEVHQTLHAECHKDTIDPAACAKCGEQIAQALEQALAEHEAIMQKLNAKAQGTQAAPQK